MSRLLKSCAWGMLITLALSVAPSALAAPVSLATGQARPAAVQELAAAWQLLVDGVQDLLLRPALMRSEPATEEPSTQLGERVQMDLWTKDACIPDPSGCPKKALPQRPLQVQTRPSPLQK
jgi:hypothetical protein